MDEFALLREKLDEAITYGRIELAGQLANEGLARSEAKESLGESEYFKAQIEIIKGNYFEAIRHFDQAISFNPRDGAAFNDRALCMVELGIIEEAFYYFDKGIEAEPDYATVYHNKGWLLNQIGRHQEAIAYFRKALELDPARAVTYENLGDAFLNLTDYRLALEAYQEAIGLLKPGYSDIKEQIVKQIELVKDKMNKERQ